MVTKKRKPTQNKSFGRSLQIQLRKYKITVILDKVLLFQFFRRLHGRFWGIVGVNTMIAILFVSYLLRPELLSNNQPISMLGTDVRTAPYFAGAMFFASYGLWRWRRYLVRTLKRPRPLTWLVMVTIFGLYVVALMPLSWYPVGYRAHMIGMTLVGLSILATVIIDSLLTRAHPSAGALWWRMVRLSSVVLIVIGGYLTLVSTRELGWLQASLPGEIMMITGYSLWIYLKTYQGEGKRTRLSRLLKKIVLVD